MGRTGLDRMVLSPTSAHKYGRPCDLSKDLKPLVDYGLVREGGVAWCLQLPLGFGQFSGKVRRSQISIVEAILRQAGGKPLHVSEIIERALKSFGQRLDRESLVSALSKRVARGDRFVRSAPNTFGLLSPVPKKEE